jgi:hypothetical protein
MTTDLLERIAELATQRKAATERLEAAVHTLLDRLSKVCELGTRVTVSGDTLQLVKVRSNIGYDHFWLYEPGDDEDSCHLDEPVGGERFLHGDFSARLQGPNRSQLLRFARRAELFVSALVSLHESDIEACNRAADSVEAAAESVEASS